MADTKLSALSSIASIATGDLVYVVDDPGGTPASTKATVDQLKTFMSASPTLVTPALGTPSSGTLTSCTGLPISTGVSGLGTGVATALAVNTGSAGAFTLNNATNTFTASQTFNAATSSIYLGANSGNLGIITLYGNTSGSVELKPAAAAGTGTVFQLPANNGTNGYVLQTNGSGVTSWVAATAGSGTKTYQRFTPLDNQPPASNFATLDTRNSIAVLDFDDTTEEAAVFVGVIPEAATLTSGIMVRIFWAATTATSGNVRWGVQFEKYGSDIDSDSFDTATEAHTATSGTSGIVVVTEITATSIDSLVAGDQFRLKVYRDVSDTTNDTVTGDAELIAVEVRQVA